jgi:hypothetical protein
MHLVSVVVFVSRALSLVGEVISRNVKLHQQIQDLGQPKQAPVRESHIVLI